MRHGFFFVTIRVTERRLTKRLSDLLPVIFFFYRCCFSCLAAAVLCLGHNATRTRSTTNTPFPTAFSAAPTIVPTMFVSTAATMTATLQLDGVVGVNQDRLQVLYTFFFVDSRGAVLVYYFIEVVLVSCVDVDHVALL